MAAIFAILFAVCGFFLRPFIMLKMYGYFVLAYFPLAPAVSFWGIFGLSMFLHFLIVGVDMNKLDEVKDHKNWGEHLTNNIAMVGVYLLIWGVAYLASLGV